MIAFDERAALAYEPFYGDETDATPFEDKFVVGRKEYGCHTCAGPIQSGERHRVKTERNNEDKCVETFRFCRACCAAMAKAEETGDDDEMVSREALRVLRQSA